MVSARRRAAAPVRWPGRTGSTISNDRLADNFLICSYCYNGIWPRADQRVSRSASPVNHSRLPSVCHFDVQYECYVITKSSASKGRLSCTGQR